jgi:hypothetical protein
MRNIELDDLLYHYTDATATLSILGKGPHEPKTPCLWLTDVHFLNDRQERWHAQDLKRDVLRDLARDPGVAGTPFAQYLEEHLKRAISESTTAWPLWYVASMSQDGGDRLSQWRGYCRGGGYSIGFKPAALQSIADGRGMELKTCVYKAAEKALLIRELMEQIRTDVCGGVTREVDRKQLPPGAPTNFRLGNQPRTPVPPEPDPVVLNAIDRVDLAFRDFGCYFKHESFEEEREWRLIAREPLGSAAIRWRTRGGVLVPYIKVDLPADLRSFVGRVCVSPGPEVNLARDAVMALLYGTTGVTVACSSVPYRDQW